MAEAGVRDCSEGDSNPRSSSRRPWRLLRRSVGSDTSHLVVSLENLSPTQVASLLRSEAVLRSRNVPVAVIAPLLYFGWPRAVWTHSARATYRPRACGNILNPKMILATSHCSLLRAILLGAISQSGIPFVIVPHGVVTPFAPPLPEGCHLFAWTLQDAEFGISGWSDVTTSVVGSQIIWDAGVSRWQTSRAKGSSLLSRPIARARSFAFDHHPEASAELARKGPVAYRPHPGETDLVSRMIHHRWQLQGIRIEPPTSRLGENNPAVAGIFSTGILEAAASGRAAFGFCRAPLSWLPEFSGALQHQTARDRRIHSRGNPNTRARCRYFRDCGGPRLIVSSGTRYLAVVPARVPANAFPRKNIRDVAGRPLRCRGPLTTYVGAQLPCGYS